MSIFYDLTGVFMLGFNWFKVLVLLTILSISIDNSDGASLWLWLADYRYNCFPYSFLH